jgi:hypothetical protein
MKKVDFLKIWFANRWYAEKAAIQSIISIQFEGPDSSEQFKKVPGAVFVEKGKFQAIIDEQQVTLDGDVKEPFFVMDDPVDIPGDFHPMLKGVPQETVFGLILCNVVLLWEVFGAIVPFKNEEFTADLVKGLLSSVMVDDPAEGEEVPEGKAPVSACMKFTTHLNFLEGLGTYYIRTPGLQGLTPSPTVMAKKKELFDALKKEGKLNDPVAFTAAVNILVKMDMEEQLNSEGASFYIEKKFIDNARKRMFIAFGVEPNADGTGWVALPMALEDGMDPEKIVDYINTAVVGSYSRSMSTGEGGAKVKDYLKIVGRRVVAEDDCGTKWGEVITIDKTAKGNWVGSFALIGGESVLITNELIDKYMGKVLVIRTTNFCITPDDNYCFMCCGSGLGSNKNQVSAEVVRMPTNAMLQKMKAAHVAGNKIVTLDLATAIK